MFYPLTTSLRIARKYFVIHENEALLRKIISVPNLHSMQPTPVINFLFGLDGILHPNPYGIRINPSYLL